MKNDLIGLGALIELALRRDRIRLAVWFGLAILLAAGLAGAIGSTFPTEESRIAYTEENNSSAIELFMIGRINATTIAGLAAWRVQGLAVILLGLASAFAVIRHTRKSEELGYREFLGGVSLGRHAALAAAVAIAAAANLVAAAVIAVIYIGLGFPVAGSLLIGAQLLTAGLFMTAVGAVVAQIAVTSRGASGLAVIVLSICYAVRGVADAIEAPALQWASPLGWIAIVRPFAVDDGRPLLLSLALIPALFALAAILDNRDLEAGLFPERDGRPHARPWLRGPASLALRLNRGTIVAWSVSIFIFGSLIGAIATSAAHQLATNDALGGLAEGPDPALGFIALVLYIFAQVVTVFGIQSILWLLAEETGGRAENLLASPISRLRWAGSAVVVALVGTIIIQAAFGLGLGIVYSATTGDGMWVLGLTAAALVKLPAIWAITAIAALLYGFAPRLAGPVAYAVLGCLFALELGADLGLVPREALVVSPYTLVPALPIGAFTAIPMLLITAAAAALVAAGATGLRRRDLLH